MKNAAAAVPARIAAATTIGAINKAKRSIFEIGQKVVHPQHGVAQIVKLEDREFERGDTRRYYEISIPGGSIVWVPVDLANSGLRSLPHESELPHCREVLQARPFLSRIGRKLEGNKSPVLRQLDACQGISFYERKML